MRLAIAQLNPVIGDLKGNSEMILDACLKTSQSNINLLATPELSLWGYPPRDLLLNPQLLDDQWCILDKIVDVISKEVPTLSLLVGIAEPTPDMQLPKLFNSVALLQRTGWEIVARKQLLPSYDVFDERRYFRSSTTPGTFKLSVKNKIWHIGLTICEDLWVEESLQNERIKGPDPITKLISSNVDMLLNLSASPFSHKKEFLRHKLAAKAAERLHCPVVYVNQVGGNDELVFDGASFVMSPQGEVIFSLPRCKEGTEVWEPSLNQKSVYEDPIHAQEMLLKMLVLGVKDYAQKCDFNSVLIGLSGGIDSALVAVIATAALGSKNVYGVLMPSPFSSDNSIKDALDLAERLGVKTTTIPITPIMKRYDYSLEESLGEKPTGLTAENLQARIRGTILMAIANEQKHLLLATGNKSELAVGYCTLYGDMNGGLAVIGDLYKTSVFNLCRWIDSEAASACKENLGLPNSKELIGKAIRLKPPSAELRPDQLDSDSLPDYTILDQILKALIEDRCSLKELLKQGFKKDLLIKIQKLLKQSEFKRRQAPPMLKVSRQAFGSGWRVPIAATYSKKDL
ncbi:MULTISPECIES: NAD+ synthase [Prochlorococcus]|uniref:NAD+ synthase n=1 Tax=Prochlorococcus TaxID=1218 RepID=UPI000533889B|nr:MULTISPECIES: NAD+ synthase [Prochlorococcus]KGG13473.1 NAD synthetase [Prochlorococcus sp. MIT 0601]